MLRVVTVLICFALIVTASSCTRTYISSGAQGITSPDGSTRLCLTSYGAYGRQYIEKTKKKVAVWIGRGSGTNKTTLFSSTYAVVGSDLTWDVQWHSAEEVAVQLYDYGYGVLGAKCAGSNHVTTLVFRWNNQSGKFFETK